MRCVGITIGPVAEALSLARTPAGFWAASYLFSALSKNLCERIAEVVGAEAIVSPYFSATTGPESDDQRLRDGVGLYHDRIIVAVDEEMLPLSKVGELIAETKTQLASALATNNNGTSGAAQVDESAVVDYFSKFFRIRAIEYESGSNPILDGASSLDALELEAQFVPSETRNLLFELLECDKNEHRNQVVKNLVLKTFNIGDAWQLLEKPRSNRSYDDRKIRDLQAIASTEDPGDNNYKRYTYYAILQCDGDGVTNVLKEMDSTEALREFSSKLLSYAREAAGLVKEYGGATLYAGGDDLLAIVPASGKDQQTVLDLAKDLNRLFSTKVPGCTLSFGITVCYYKYPLYEAFPQAWTLLETAKKQEGKNALAVSLLKHSGQNASFVLKTIAKSSIVDDLTNLITWNWDEQYYNSVEQHLRNFAALFDHAATREEADNLFRNVFDVDLRGKEEQLRAVEDLFWLCCRPEDSTSTNRAVSLNKDVSAIDALLRFVRFFSEEGVE